MTTQTVAQEKLAFILEALSNGKTVYLCTAMSATKLTAKNAAKWNATGRPVIKTNTAGTSLLLASGRNYLCADYCAIRVEG